MSCLCLLGGFWNSICGRGDEGKFAYSTFYKALVYLWNKKQKYLVFLILRKGMDSLQDKANLKTWNQIKIKFNIKP